MPSWLLSSDSYLKKISVMGFDILTIEVTKGHENWRSQILVKNTLVLINCLFRGMCTIAPKN